MKPELVVMRRLAPETTMQRLADGYTLHSFWEADDIPAFLDRARGARGLVTTGSIGADSALIEGLPNLGIIANFGVGVDKVDFDAVDRRGIVVTVTAGVLTDAVADLGLALWLAVLRRVAEADRFVRAGRWPDTAFGSGRGARGRTAGIIGLGQIGRAVAQRLTGFGVVIAYTDLAAVPDLPHRFVADPVQLAAESDFLIVCAAGGPGTAGLVNEEVLTALGPDGILVNLARGSIVDEPALIAALEAGRVAGAGLDVFAAEPNVPVALMAMDNVVLMPHQASNTVETRIAMGENVLANLAAHFAGEPVPTPYRRA